jgi:hypothetical protein
MRGTLYHHPGEGGDERFLVVLDYEPPRESGKIAVVDALILTPTNMLAAVGRRVAIPRDELESGWHELDVDEAAE